jgi:hypothetical protein
VEVGKNATELSAELFLFVLSARPPVEEAAPPSIRSISSSQEPIRNSSNVQVLCLLRLEKSPKPHHALLPSSQLGAPAEVELPSQRLPEHREASANL